MCNVTGLKLFFCSGIAANEWQTLNSITHGIHSIIVFYLTWTKWKLNFPTRSHGWLRSSTHADDSAVNNSYVRLFGVRARIRCDTKWAILFGQFRDIIRLRLAISTTSPHTCSTWVVDESYNSPEITTSNAWHATQAQINQHPSTFGAWMIARAPRQAKSKYFICHRSLAKRFFILHTHEE